MNRFVKKHYHIISFIILAVIFVAWGLLEDTLLSKTSSVLSTSGQEEIVPEDATPDETTYADNTASESSSEAQPDVASESSSPDLTSEKVEAPAPVESTGPVEASLEDTEIPDTLEEPDETAEVTETTPEPEQITPPEEEVVLETGTYGPGEGKMPFDLCLANVRESLNVRSGPSEDQEVISKFYPTCYARLVEKGSEWSLISSGEITGYSHNDYLITGDKAMQKLIDSDKLRVTVTQKLINVRAENSTDAEILRQAKKGETFKCIPSESDSDWFAIIYDDGNIAFVATTLAHVTAEMDELRSLTPVG